MKTTCAYGAAFEKMGYTCKQRFTLFFTICIFFRLLMAGSVLNFGNKKPLQYAVLVGSIVAIYLNYKSMNDNVWWSRKMHLGVATLLFIVTVLVLCGKADPKYMAYVLYLDVTLGFIYTLYRKPWENKN